ncbi:hypothetical protein CDL12_22259 [Handroanthus impetiginosus]|uniref:Transcription repressor n=1 Tax=Handroanthus impetiginosus TaxID=429701 RepID=A0A2G9GJ32_9LAMI|nr:hypothetical protein CDL12_22259 [Handroanthus impetiginosus]
MKTNHTHPKSSKKEHFQTSMEENHHHFLLKLSRLLSSSLSTSCRFNTLPDVADTRTNSTQIPHENDLNSPFFKIPHKRPSKQALLFPPPKQNQSSSSNSGQWFTNTDAETDIFFSLSSNSGYSFPASHLETPEYEMGYDHISTEIYYSADGGFGRRRRHWKRRRKIKKRKQVGWMMEESYAVEKSSSDPYEDFRASMVEMIIEKQIFGKDDLERMLICYLGLNEGRLHGIIVDVFSEICRTLFCN